MIIDQSWITLVSASTALIASIAGPFVTLRVGRQQFKANVLSVNRQRWIETLRDALSHVVAQLQAAATVKQATRIHSLLDIAGDANLLGRVEDLTRTIARIELLLNPLEPDHRQLHVLLDRALDALRAPEARDDLVAVTDAISAEILVVAQRVLKREWIRVKRGT